MQAVKGKSFIVITCIFSMMLLLTNIIGLKIFSLFNLPLPAAILVYPITFILSGLVTEIYGKDHAKFMIYVGFFLSFVSFWIVNFLINLPPHDFWFNPVNSFHYVTAQDYQNAYEATISTHRVSVVASMLAYLCAQLSDIFIFSKIKTKTKGRFLWLRSNLSAWISQFIDTCIVSSIVLSIGMKMGASHVLMMIGTTYLCKIIISALSTPFVYLAVRLIKRKSPDLVAITN